MEIREGIKDFSDWPTIPQLYIGGEFQGGCDIVREMYEAGELHEALGIEKPAVPEPDITVTETAMEVLQNAKTQSGGGEPTHRGRLAIPPQFGFWTVHEQRRSRS